MIDPDSAAWDANSEASTIVSATESGHEVFSAGFWKGNRISKFDLPCSGMPPPDGMTWERYEQNPVVELTNENGMAMAVRHEGGRRLEHLLRHQGWL